MPGSWSDFLKLRSGPAPPPSSEAGAVRVYADAGGALRSIQSDGTDAPIGGGGSMPGIPLAAGPAWAPGVAVIEGYQITASYLGQSRVWEAMSSGTTTDDGSVFPDDYSPSLEPLGETTDNDFSWRYLGIVGEVSYQYLPAAGIAAIESGYYDQSGGATSIANNGNAHLPFDSFAGGTAVLDISDPLAPLVLKAGLFVVNVEVKAAALSAGGSIELRLILDLNGEGIEVRNTGTADSVGGASPYEVSSSWVMAAGDALQLTAFNFDGVASRDFHINNATVSRVGPA